MMHAVEEPTTAEMPVPIPGKLSIAAETKAWIRKGIEGGNKGLSLGLPRLEKYIPGLQKSTTYVLGGESGSGKSKLAASMFIYSPYEQLMAEGKADKFHVLLFSLEIEKRQVLINAAINRLYRQYNILTDVNVVLSRGENRCPQELYGLVCAELDYWEGLESCLHIYDAGTGPTGINKQVLAYFLKNGTLHYKTVNNGDGDFEIPDYYEANDPEVIVSPQVDHVGLLRGEKDLRSKKEVIDKLSTEYAIPWRNRFGASTVFVQQLNRSIGNMDRQKLDRMRPQLQDFKETANTQEDANVVLGLFSPNRYQIADYEGYKVSILKDRVRTVHILKNRDGEADKMLACKFLGECGHFEELPPAKELGIGGSTTYEQILKN
jgi:hypothetical protein